MTMPAKFPNRYRACGDALLHIRAFALGASDSFLPVQTVSAIAVLGGVLEFIKDEYAVSSRTEVRDASHQPFKLSVGIGNGKQHGFISFSLKKKKPTVWERTP